MIWGVSMLFTEGMLLHGIGKWAEEWKYRWILKPVFLCPPCQASIYGIAASLYLGYDIPHAIVLILAVGGLNYIIANR